LFTSDFSGGVIGARPNCYVRPTQTHRRRRTLAYVYSASVC